MSADYYAAKCEERCLFPVICEVCKHGKPRMLKILEFSTILRNPFAFNDR
jgi:hypothetical protein